MSKINRGLAHDLAEVSHFAELKKPPLYGVVLLNDDYTPMDFVVRLLEKFFGMDKLEAIDVMLKIHTSGEAICGVFSREVAESKVEQVIRYARHHEHPLLCILRVMND